MLFGGRFPLVIENGNCGNVWRGAESAETESEARGELDSEPENRQSITEKMSGFCRMPRESFSGSFAGGTRFAGTFPGEKSWYGRT